MSLHLEERFFVTLVHQVSVSSWFLAGSLSCVGYAIVQGDEGPVSEVAQGVEVHGVPVRHGEKQEEEEGEVEQEVEGEKEENAQRRRHMCMDGMKGEKTRARP